jgi:hypothetical protein
MGNVVTFSTKENIQQQVKKTNLPGNNPLIQAVWLLEQA